MKKGIVELVSKQRGNYVKQKYIGEVKSITDEFVVLEDVLVENVGRNFSFELNEIAIPLNALTDESLKIL